MKRRASNELDSKRAKEVGTSHASLDHIAAESFNFRNNDSILAPAEESPQNSEGERADQGTEHFTAAESLDNGPIAAAADLDRGTLLASNVASPAETAESEYICYGMVCDINCQLLESSKGYDVTQLSQNQLPGNYVLLSFSIHSKRCIVGDTKDSPLFQVNAKISKAIIEIANALELHFDAYGTHDDLLVALGDLKSKKARTSTLRLHANAYGPYRNKDEIGCLLSAHRIFLQDPLWQAPDVPYQNPHMIEFDNISDSDIWLAELTYKAVAKSQSSSEYQWNDVLDDLPQHHIYNDQSGNTLMKSTLYRHQKEACDYMLKRETGHLDASMKLWSLEANDDGVPVYRHNVIASETFNQPDEPLGGILADDMGLGKTLSAISLITNSLDRAVSFAAQPHPGHCAGRYSLTRTRATLVVVPSLLLLEDWIKEIDRRTLSGSLRVTRYHGHERSRHFSDLLNFDIVLTTYGTVTTEFRKTYNRGREVLYYLRWFRIILDEAHTIRSQRTRQFEAIQNLEGHHHWCLTGTPISNKIEDIGALLRFCQVAMLKEPSCFRENVTKVAKKSFSQGSRVLRQVLTPLCLRRTKALLDIPQPHTIEVLVEFTTEERKRYEDLEAHSRKLLISSSTSRRSKTRGDTMLHVILRLRICCNLGTYMHITDAEAEDQLDPDEALTLLEEKNEANCAFCSSQVRLINQPDDQGSGTLGTCLHVLCASCKETIPDRQTHKDSYLCPVCNYQVLQQVLPLNALDKRATPENEGKHSAKIERLVEDLSETQHCHKSIVFSAWRKTLDVASDACRKAGIFHVRIDGSTPQPFRKRALDGFTMDPSVRVLLITFGTGALGLNLAAATRIHILEPQWNPSVEEQAIGRAVRIGQEKNATVIRYIVKDSIEHQIQSYQRRKINLAAGGFGDDVQHDKCDTKVSAVWLSTCRFDVPSLTKGKGTFFKNE